MSLKVSVNLGKFEKKMTKETINRAMYALMNQAHADMNLYAPKRQGHLREKSSVIDNRIAYFVPYAKVQFRGLIVTKTGRIVRIRNYTTAGTGRRWDLRAKANHMKQWKRAFIKGGQY